MIAQDLVVEALEEIGAHSPFEQQGGSDFDLGLRRLNSMLDSWKLDRLMIDHQARSLFTLTANTASFAIGEGAIWDLPRPDFLAAAGYIDANGMETELHIFTDEEWQCISLKSQASNRPSGIRYEKTMTPTIGSGTIYPWPIPAIAAQVALYVPTPLLEVASLSTAIYLAPGYREALFYNLAVRLAPAFGKTPSPTTLDMARAGRALIKSSNSRPPRISLAELRMTSDRRSGSDLIDFLTRNY